MKNKQRPSPLGGTGRGLPLVGRFLSPDNNVQMPDFSQNFNRYSYCINKPLKYKDPNGEWFLFDDAIEFIVGGIVNLIFNADEVDNFWEGLSYFVSGGAGAWIAGQSFGLATPAGTAVTSFGNNLLKTNFLTKEKGYSFKSISNEQWKKIGKKTALGAVAGFGGKWVSDKISNKLIQSTKIKGKFWTEATENIIEGGVSNGLYNYGESTIIYHNKPFSKKALSDLGSGIAIGATAGFTFTVVKQKIVEPSLMKIQISLSINPTNNTKPFDYIYNNRFSPYWHPSINNPVIPGNRFNPTINYPKIHY